MHELASRAFFELDTKGFNSRLEMSRGWRFYTIEYPILDVGFFKEDRTGLRLQFNCKNWNESPPSISLMTLDGVLLTSVAANPSNIFNSSQHPITGRPFICMRGTHEYHTHESHLTDLWDNYRNHQDNNLGGLITQIWHAWLKGND